MTKMPRIVGIVGVVAGVILIIAGAVTYYVVHKELAEQKITVSEDADRFAGKPVEGPFTAYAQAMVINKHAEEISGGLTYAQMDRDDPNRDQVLTASFLQASLFTSVVAFGVAALVMGLGVLFILVGLALFGIEQQLASRAPAPDTVSPTSP